MANDAVGWLMNWYRSHCDDDWEHSYGVTIDTIDNPGWSLKVDLADTELDGRTLAEVTHNYEHDSDWWMCRTENNKFVGVGGPLHLESLIYQFKRWATGASVRP
ncbi:MAG: immunity 53 family protein [Sphingomonas sp.]|uniref:immunity 53 family protein n=1 Tax=Sphingomonas sp. TaxID=28214 RepID=UPI001AD41567|nr:immunity 53 family protein [Sphingomonas sp.]MBN8814095.1 immunity 53 family protein [Sphingomonas sp.]